MKTKELAERIYKAFIYEMRDADATVESVEEDIKTNPQEVISFLLDYVENN